MAKRSSQRTKSDVQEQGLPAPNPSFGDRYCTSLLARETRARKASILREPETCLRETTLPFTFAL